MGKLQQILVKARRQVYSEIIGNNPSVFKGEGYDFIELREYMVGDDIRHIDWNITAKMQKPFIKVFREERELNVVVASMCGGSMHFGSKRFKQDLLAELVALLNFSTLKNGDLCTNYLFADKQYYHSKPTKKLHSVMKSTQSVLEFEALNKSSDYKLMNDTLFQRTKRRSLIIVLADFFEIPDFKVLAKKHEVLAIVVRDRLEENPPEFGFSSLMDPESGSVVEGDFNKRSVQTYEAKVKAHDKLLFETFKKQRIRFVKVYTDDLPAVKLRRLFEGH